MCWSIVVVVGLTCVGCSNDKGAASQRGSSAPAAVPTPAGASNPAASTAANAVAAAQKSLKDACSFLPKDTIEKLVPGPSKPEGMQFPLSCAARGSVAAIEITFDTGPATGLTGDAVSGLGVAAYAERLDPKTKGDVYLTIVLGNDKYGTNHNLHVEVSGHDGKDHLDDATGLARQVLAQLH